MANKPSSGWHSVLRKPSKPAHTFLTATILVKLASPKTNIKKKGKNKLLCPRMQSYATVNIQNASDTPSPLPLLKAALHTNLLNNYVKPDWASIPRRPYLFTFDRRRSKPLKAAFDIHLLYLTFPDKKNIHTRRGDPRENLI